MPTTESKDEAFLLILQKEISELEQALTAKKLQLEELQATIQQKILLQLIFVKNNFKKK